MCVAQHGRALERIAAVLFPHRIDGGVQALRLLLPRVLLKQRELLGVSHKIAHRHAECADGMPPGIERAEEFEGKIGDPLSAAGGNGRSALFAEAAQLVIHNAHLDRLRPPHALLRDARRDALRKHIKQHSDVLLRGEIAIARQTVADALDLPLRALHGDGRLVPAVGIGMQDTSPLAQFGDEHAHVCPREIADGRDPQHGKPLRRRLAHIEQVCGGQGPRQRLIVLFVNDGHGVRLFEIGSELCKDLVPAHPHADRHADLALDCLTDGVRDLLSLPEEIAAARDVQPAFVDTVRLDLIGIARVDGAHRPGDPDIGRKIGGNADEVGTFLTRLPECLTRPDALHLGEHIFGEHHAVSVLKAAAHRNGNIPQFGAAQALHRGVEIVQITVQNAAFH